MRKNSIKALSLILSLLLVIPMLASLPFSVQAAETGTVVGDFDGDGGLGNGDITALQAVLDRKQEVDVDEITKYDISGNRMVEFEDLVVLKNLVDPSQPALKDLLADDETEDILSLVNSTEGGVLQSAVVRGDSTKALEVNATGSVKVLFTAPQNWSRKTTLEMDTLWEKGSRTVTVILLGADGETVLGTAGDADSQEAGWSHVSVPLTGVTAQSRKEVGGFVINVAEDAHAYLDNLYLYLEPRDITTGVLTEDEKALLSALTLEKYTAAGTDAANQKLAVWAYKEAGVDVSASFDQSVFNLMKKIFEGDSTEGRTPIPADSASYEAKYSKMLVEGYYGGTEVKTADKLFTAADFQVGDLFCAVYYPDPSSTSKCYYVGIYLGDSKFLMSCSEGGWSAQIDTELVFTSTLAEEMGIYFVLRPELLAPQEEPEVPVVLRDITTGVLTDAEKALLSALTVEKYTAAGTADTKNQKIVTWAYGEAGIDVSDSFDLTAFYLMKAIFEGDSTDGRTPIQPGADNYVAKYSEMLVDGYYGGTEVKTAGKLFTEADFRVGDVFCAVYYPDPNSADKSYYVGIYLGDGEFLMSRKVGDNWEATIDTELVFKTTLAEEMGIYFVLSPEQLVPRADGELTVAVQRKLSALTKADLDAANKTNDTGVIKWFCQQEGMTSNDVKNFSSILSMSNSLFNKTGTWTYKPGDTTYHKLFVDGYYGGIKFGAENSKTFTEADFKVGDIFCVQAPNGDSTRYYAGMYQGDGKFLMYDRTGASNYVDTTMAFGNIAETCNYYFVLRPSQYIYSAN